MNTTITGVVFYGLAAAHLDLLTNDDIERIEEVLFRQGMKWTDEELNILFTEDHLIPWLAGGYHTWNELQEARE